MTDRIEKTVDLAASMERVWRALTDAREFGAWFGVALEGPFVIGEPSTGHITHPGYEHVPWRAQVVAMEPPRRFAFTWRPYAVDPDRDYTREAPTLVEFTLEPIATGVRLHIVESGFDRLAPERRDEAFRMNEGGWSAQVDNIARHLARD